MEGCLTLQADAVACGRAGSQVSQQENRQTERQAHGRRNERTRPTRRQTSRDQQRNTGTDIVRIDRVTPSQTQEHRHHPGQTGENKESCTKRCKDRRKHRQRQTNRQANNRQSDAGTNNDGHTRTLYGCRLKSGTRNEEADEQLQGARGCVVLAGRCAHVSAEFWTTEHLFCIFLAETMQEPSEPCRNHAIRAESVLHASMRPLITNMCQPSLLPDSGETAEDIARTQDVTLSRFRQSYDFHHQCMRHTESSGHTSVIARDANTSLVTQSSRSKECKTIVKHRVRKWCVAKSMDEGKSVSKVMMKENRRRRCARRARATSNQLRRRAHV